MGLFGKKKEVVQPISGLEMDMDVPPKPPEFRVEGPLEPTPEELNPPKFEPLPEIQPISVPEIKPVHVDDFNMGPEPAAEIQQAIAQVQQPVPKELPQLDAPLVHEEYHLTQDPAPMGVHQPSYLYPDRPLGDSVLLQDQGPLFVTLDGYEKMITNLVKIRAAVQGAEDRMTGVGVLRNKEEAMYSKFQLSLEQVERKLSYVDKLLFGEAEE